MRTLFGICVVACAFGVSPAFAQGSGGGGGGGASGGSAASSASNSGGTAGSSLFGSSPTLSNTLRGAPGSPGPNTANTLGQGSTANQMGTVGGSNSAGDGKAAPGSAIDTLTSLNAGVMAPSSASRSTR